jgi:O-antigen/teichoic acid export membrane protein
MSHLLVAHQRYDIANGASALSFVANFGVMWLSLAAGGGVLSMLWGLAAGAGVTTLITAAACVRLRLFPEAGQWGMATWERFRELFALGRDVFLISVGAQLVYASQAILVTRILGLETGAIWTICSRTVTLATQVIYRFFDLSCPVLAEMLVRGERDRLFGRFRSIVVLSTSMGLLAAVSLLTCNSAFVAWWTAGRVQWPTGNNALLSLWLIICVVSHPHVGLVGQTKQFRFLRWIFFLEGILFVGLAVLTMPSGGLMAMVASSVAAGLMCSFPYSLWRTQQQFGLKWKEVLWEWSRPGLRLAAWVAPLAMVVWWLSRPWPAGAQLLVCGLTAVGVGGALLLRVGLEPQLRRELHERVPVTLRPMVGWLLGRI